MAREFISRLFGAGGVIPSAPTVPLLAITDNGDGSGGSASITAQSGTTNTLYSSPWLSTFGDYSWTTVGAITGSGTISLPSSSYPDGFYVWMVGSAAGGPSSMSSLVYQSLTDVTDAATGARRSLAFGMLNLLTAGLNLSAPGQIQIMFDGKPPGNATTYFYAIHHGEITNNWLLGDMSYYSLNVTISARAQQPFDRIGPNLVDLLDGLDDKSEAVRTYVFAHQWSGQYSGAPGIMSIANTYLAGYHWTEALYPQSISPPTPQRAEWWAASDGWAPKGKTAQKSASYSGFSVAIRFGGAVRMMNNADAEGG